MLLRLVFPWYDRSTAHGIVQRVRPELDSAGPSSDDTDETVPSTANGAAWATSPTPRRRGELITRADICHLHPDRESAESCGALLGGTPDLVRLDKLSPRVWVVGWSLSDVSDGQLRPSTRS